MAAILILVVMTIVLLSSNALTPIEEAAFKATSYSEKNTGRQGTVSITTNGNYYRIVSNGIPDHKTGSFPGPGNPNSIGVQTFSQRFFKNPVNASSPTCLPNGPIAFARNGIPLFNPFNFLGENAVEGDIREQFDDCDWHPDGMSIYHYNQTPDCVYNGMNDEFLGVALDGLLIYGIKDSNGKEITSAELDDCHGRIEDGHYRCRMTRDYPYIMGCFRGTPSPDIEPRRLKESSCRIIGSAAGLQTLPLLSVVLMAPSLKIILY